MTKTPITNALKSILSSEDKWTKGALAKDTEGKSKSVFDPDATCFCLSGAIQLVYHTLPYGPQKEKPRDFILQAIYEHTRFQTIIGFNDTSSTTFQDIQWLLDKAAEIEENEHTT